jgi:hypothetical protein
LKQAASPQTSGDFIEAFAVVTHVCDECALGLVLGAYTK